MSFKKMMLFIPLLVFSFSLTGCGSSTDTREIEVPPQDAATQAAADSAYEDSSGEDMSNYEN